MDWIVTTPKDMALVLLSAVIAYASLVILTRLSGIRSFSKMSGFDFAVTVAIGSVFASVVMGKSPSLTLGVWVLAVLFFLQIGFAVLRKKFTFLSELVDNAPRVIMIGDQMQPDQMKKAKITRADLQAKLREANVMNYDQVKVVIAETTGDVSVLHTSDSDVSLDMNIFDGVIGKDRIEAFYG